MDKQMKVVILLDNIFGFRGFSVFGKFGDFILGLEFQVKIFLICYKDELYNWLYLLLVYGDDFYNLQLER